MKDFSMYPKPLTNKERRSEAKKNPVKMQYLAEMTVEEGLDLIQDVLDNHTGPEKLVVNGFIVKRDFDRFRVLKSCELKCYRCGVKATHVFLEKHRNDKVMPFQLNVYAGKKMLTWDHILPKSYDGSNDPLNGRCACARCNENRGNEMTLAEMVWVATQNPLRMYKEFQPTKATIREVIGLVRAEEKRESQFSNVSPEKHLSIPAI